MLHILLLIIKIIGIILAAILGILVLLVCIVLFMPLIYEVRSECHGTFESLTARVRCTWFLRMLRFTAVLQDKEFRWNLRLLWIQMPKEESEKKKEKKREKKREEGNADEEKTFKAVEDQEEQSEKGNEDIKTIEKKAEKEPELSKGAETEHEKVKTRISEKIMHSEPKKSKLTKIREACQNFCRKIKYTIRQICGRIKILIQKKEHAVSFLTDEVHKAAFVKIKNEVFRLLRILKPKKLKLYLHYGFEDPYYTGQVLAGIAMLYPFWGRNVQIVPDFEHQILEGNVYIKGKLRGIHFAVFAFRLLLSGAIRSTYKDIRSFEL